MYFVLFWYIEVGVETNNLVFLFSKCDREWRAGVYLVFGLESRQSVCLPDSHFEKRRNCTTGIIEAIIILTFWDIFFFQTKSTKFELHQISQITDLKPGPSTSLLIKAHFSVRMCWTKSHSLALATSLAVGRPIPDVFTAHQLPPTLELNTLFILIYYRSIMIYQLISKVVRVDRMTLKKKKVTHCDW